MADQAVLGARFGTEVCEIFGLNPRIVRSMRLEIQPAALVTLHVEIIVTASSGAMLRDVMQKYSLQEKGAEPTV